MDVGLDEIIKKKFKKGLQGKRVRGALNGKAGRNGIKMNGVKRKGPMGGAGPKPGAKIVDARLKIIEKTRSKIVDARERLNQRMRQTDARERIMRRTGASGAVSKLRSDTIIPRRTIRNSVSRLQQEAFAPSYAPPMRTEGFRTMKNPVRGTTAYMDIDSEWNSRLNSLPRLEVHIPRIRESATTRSPLIRPSPEDNWRLGKATNSMYRSKDDIKSRLEPMRQDGYRIVVSNLQPTVTHEDIKELFEDIGTLIGSRVVRPGTAEVVYKNMEDAVAAVDTYHNRQLDGQPMKCLLVQPRASNTSKHIGTKGCIVPDISTVHKALFTK